MASPTSTDVVQRLYAVSRRQVDLPLPPPRMAPPPTAIELLRELELNFEDLPSALQHALLWETGFASMADGTAPPFRTSCGLTTADALAMSTITAPTCALAFTAVAQVVWLSFSGQSSLPTLNMTAFGLQDGTLYENGVPCSSTFNQSRCIPQPSATVKSWLLEYATQIRGQQVTLVNGSESSSGTPVSASTVGYAGKATSYASVQDGNIGESSTNSSVLASTPGPGLLSDFSTMLYSFHVNGVSLSRIELATPVPSDVLARLESSHLKYTSLSGLLQRAILWDSGYALVPHDESLSRVSAVPIYVKCGLRMADLAPDRSYFESIGCSVLDCSQANRSSGGITYSFRAQPCLDNLGSHTMSSISRCAVPSQVSDSLSVPAALTSTTWAVGSIVVDDRSPVPQFWLKHTPPSSFTNNHFAIHSAIDEVSSGVCPNAPSFIIPCTTFDQLSAQQEWCRPIQSAVISTWLRQEQHQEMALATLILLAGAILVALALDLFADRKPRFFGNGRVTVEMPSLTSTVLDEGAEQTQSQSVYSDRTGASSVRSARSVQSYR